MEEKNITLRVTIGAALRGSGRIIQTTLKANVKNGNHTNNFCTNIYNVLVNNSYCKPSIIDQGYVPFALSFTNNDSLKINESTRDTTQHGKQWKQLQNIIEIKSIIQIISTMSSSSYLIDIRLVRKDIATDFGKKKIENPNRTSSKSSSSSSSSSSYFGVGIVGETKDAHHGTLLRSSYQYGASFICTIGGKHSKHTMRDTDTSKAWCYIPIFSYPTVEKLTNCAPYNCPWVACIDGPGGIPLNEFKHPQRALYLFPGDDDTLLQTILPKCKFHISPPRSTKYKGAELTTSPIFGSMVLYDRHVKENSYKQLLNIDSASKNHKRKAATNNNNQVSLQKKNRKKKGNNTMMMDVDNDDDKDEDETSIHSVREWEEKYYNYKNVLHVNKEKEKTLNHLEQNQMKHYIAIWTNHAYKNRLAVYLRDIYNLYIVAHSNQLCIFNSVRNNNNNNNDDNNNNVNENYTTLEKLCHDSLPLRAMKFCIIYNHIVDNTNQICQLIVNHYDSINNSNNNNTKDNNSNKKIVYRIQTRPNTLTNKIIPLLPDKIELNPKVFTHVIYIALQDFSIKSTDTTNKDNNNNTSLLLLKYFVGIVDKKFNYSTSNGSKLGLKFFEKPKISRAYYKLHELEQRKLVQFVNTNNMNNNNNNANESKIISLAIDIGASPGGWTEFLVEKQNRMVLAIDPGNMDEKLMKNPNVIHINKKMEDSMEIINSYASNTSKYSLDMIVCDMNMDPRDSARICSQVVPYLKTNGILILTIKLVLHGKKMYEEFLNETSILLSNAGYKTVKELWLFANGRHERTLIAYKE